MARAAGLLFLPLVVFGEWFTHVGPYVCGDCEYSVNGSGELELEDNCSPACAKFVMKYRDLTTVPEDIFDHQSLKDTCNRVELGHNQITELSANTFQGMSLLSILTLKNNRLKEVPEGLTAGLSEMKIFQLDNNLLQSVPAGLLTPMTQLVNLGLGLNYLDTLPDGFIDGLTMMREIHLAGNRFTTLPDDFFKDTPDMSEVYLGGNKISSLPEGIFTGMTRLYKLNLSGNMLTALSDTLFENVPEMRFLYLENNMLATLPAGIFDETTSLLELHLKENDITKIPKGVFNTATSLRWLDLTDNLLTSLPTDMFSAHSEWDGVLLKGNPLRCKVDFTANVKEVPDGYDSLPACEDKSTCINESSGTRGHEVIEVAGEKHTVKETQEQCNQLCWDTAGCQLWTFNFTKKTCTIKKEAADFEGFIFKANRASAYVQDPATWDDTACNED